MNLMRLAPKWFVISILLFTVKAAAHEQHEELLARAPLPGTSVFQLDSTWKDQNAASVKLSALRGSPRLVVMLYTRCETACPLIVSDVQSIVAELTPAQREKIQVSIFSLDSYRETPQSLAAFAAKRKLPKSWMLLTSNASAVAELAGALGIRYKRLSNGEFVHSNVIYFLNANGEITAQKEGLNTSRVEFMKKISAAYP